MASRSACSNSPQLPLGRTPARQQKNSSADLAVSAAAFAFAHIFADALAAISTAAVPCVKSRPAEPQAARR